MRTHKYIVYKESLQRNWGKKSSNSYNNSCNLGPEYRLAASKQCKIFQ